MPSAHQNTSDVMCVPYVCAYLFNVSNRYSMADMSVLSYPYPPNISETGKRLKRSIEEEIGEDDCGVWLL